MSKSVLSANHFHDEEAAYKWVEERVWPKDETGEALERAFKRLVPPRQTKKT
jgi:hypothetical protein